MGTLRHSDPFSAEWVTLVLIVVFIGAAWTNFSSFKKWKLLSEGTFRMRLGRQMMREEMDLQERGLLLLLALSALVSALFAVQATAVLAGVSIDLPGFGRTVLAVVAIMAGQFLLMRLLAFLFQRDGGTSEYLYTGFILLIVNALVLLPIVILIAYHPPWREQLAWAGLFLVGLMVLYRWVRAFAIGSGEAVPAWIILLYLCAAELIPMALAVRTF